MIGGLGDSSVHDRGLGDGSVHDGGLGDGSAHDGGLGNGSAHGRMNCENNPVSTHVSPGIVSISSVQNAINKST